MDTELKWRRALVGFRISSCSVQLRLLATELAVEGLDDSRLSKLNNEALDALFSCSIGNSQSAMSRPRLPYWL